MKRHESQCRIISTGGALNLQDMAEKYPETALIVEMARAAWNGDIKAARVNFPLSDRLKMELKKLLGKEIKTVFLTDSDVRYIKSHGGIKRSCL